MQDLTLLEQTAEEKKLCENSESELPNWMIEMYGYFPHMAPETASTLLSNNPLDDLPF